MELTSEILDRIKTKIGSVLANEFPEAQKRKVLNKSGRFTFACPYCGDSYTDFHRKRCNFYFDSGAIHCYNGGCNAHASIVKFLRDFNNPIDSLEDVDALTTIYTQNIKSNTSTYSSGTGEKYGALKLLDDISIDRERLKTKWTLVEINDNPQMKSWLRDRMIINGFDRFLVDPISQELYILNLTNTGKVCGLQIRTHNIQNKYLSYDISRVYAELLMEDIPETEMEIDRLDKASLYFGIFQVDLLKTFTLFEGPLDALFMRNSIGISGINRDTSMFEEFDTVRFMMDNDWDGLKYTERKVTAGFKCFIWKKYLEDNNIKDKTIKDLNDLVKYNYRNGANALKLDDYFSENKWDLYYV